MPTIAIERDELFKKIGKVFTEKEFDELCFDFGVELDEVTTKGKLGKAKADDKADGEKIVYKIDIPANRYDLLCIEGFARAIRVFVGAEPAPVFKVLDNPSKDTVMVVKKDTSRIRPFVVCAILRDVTIDEAAYNSFLDLQDHLHRNLCRRRSLVAIGTHDLDSVKGPFTYEALPPKDIKFRHLFADKEMEGQEMMDWFRNDPAGKHISEYTNLIYDSPVYPVIYDSNRTVLSLPPIINGYVSRISTKTKNVFIECTATDLTKARIVLNILVCMFAEYCSSKFTVEPVKVIYEAGGAGVVSSGGYTGATAQAEEIYPDLSSYSLDVKVNNICSILGVKLTPEECCKLCLKMMLSPSVKSDGVLKIDVPPTRADILHEVDVVEDVGIAYGFNNVPLTVPPSHVPGKELPINRLTDMVCFSFLFFCMLTMLFSISFIFAFLSTLLLCTIFYYFQHNRFAFQLLKQDLQKYSHSVFAAQMKCFSICEERTQGMKQSC